MKFFKKGIICLGFTSLMSLGIGLSLVNSSYKTAFADEPSPYISADVYATANDAKSAGGTISDDTSTTSNYWGKEYENVLNVGDVAYTSYNYKLKLDGLSFSTMPVHYNYATHMHSAAGFYFNTNLDVYYKSWGSVTVPTDSMVFTYINGTSGGGTDNTRLRIGKNTFSFDDNTGVICYKDQACKTAGMNDNGHDLSQQIQLCNSYAIEGNHCVLRNVTYHFEKVSGNIYKATIWSDHGHFLKQYVSASDYRANNTKPIWFYFDASEIVDSEGKTYFHTFGHSYNNGSSYACDSSLRFYSMREDTPKYTVSIDYDSSSYTNQSFQYTVSSVATNFKLTVPGKTGHTFLGFESSDTSIVTVRNDSKLGWIATTVGDATGNATITAKYRANVWPITYKDEGGSNFTGTHQSGYPTEHTYGTTTYLDTPTRTGYNFKGYFKNSGCTGTAITYIGAVDYNEAITIYAKWEAKQYTITYKDQSDKAFSGTHAASYPTTHTYGTATTLDSPTKTGYSFKGYFTNSGCTGTAVSTLTATGYTANITLYAKWEINKYAANINRGTNINENHVYVSTDPNGSSLSAPGTTFNYGTKVYGFAKLPAHFVLNSTSYPNAVCLGSNGTEDCLWRVDNGGTISENGYDFGTINAVGKSYTVQWNMPPHTVANSIKWYSKYTDTGSSWKFDEKDRLTVPFTRQYYDRSEESNGRFYYYFDYIDGYHNTSANPYLTNQSYNYGWVAVSNAYGWTFNEATSTATLTFGDGSQANTYTASYSLHGGTAGSSAPTNWTYDTPQQVSDPTQTGFRFMGWQVSTGVGSYSSTQSGTYTTITDSSTPVKGNNGTTWFKNNCVTHNSSVTFTAVWDGVVSAISFNTLGGTPATTTIYCKYANGFFSDAACLHQITSIPTSNLPKLGVNDFEGYYYSGTQIVDKDGKLTTNLTLFPTGDATVTAKYTSLRLVGSATNWKVPGAPKLEPYGTSGNVYKASNINIVAGATMKVVKATIDKDHTTEADANIEWIHNPETVKSSLPAIYPVSKDSGGNAKVDVAGNYDFYYNESDYTYSYEPLDARLTVSIDGNFYDLTRNDEGKAGDVLGQWSTTYSGSKNDVVAFYCNGVLLTTGADKDSNNALINVNGRIELYNDVDNGTIYFKSYSDGKYSAWANTKTQLGGIKTGENLYLKDNGGVTTWSGAGIAVYFFGNGDGWSTLATKVYKDGDENFEYFEVTVPKNNNGQIVTFTSFVVCRYDNSKNPQVDKWEGMYQQTENINFTTSNDSCRLFEITGYQEVEKGKTVTGNLLNTFDDIDRLNTYSSYYDDACEFCALAAASHLNELKAIWAKLEAQYKAMSDYDRAKFTNAIANPGAESDSLERIVSLYDYCVMKYGTNNLKDFAERGITSNGVVNMSFSMFIDFTDGNSSNPTLIILIVSVITGLSIGGYLLLKRKKD